MQTRSLSDQDVVEAIKQGDHLDSTVRHLYEQYFEALAHFIRNNSGGNEDAEDFFQEALVVFINVVRKDKFRGDSTIKTFLYAIIRNLWLNELKRRGKADARENAYHDQQEHTYTPPLVSENETTQRIVTFFSQLGDNCKKILVMHYYQNYSMKDIAQAMRYESEQVARNAKYKCSKKLTTMLDSSPALRKAFKDLLTQ